jgi:hypothetical protein
MTIKLLDQVRETARLKHLSQRTENAYVQWIKQYVLFHKKQHPMAMGENEVRQFLIYLVQSKYVSSSTQNQVFSQQISFQLSVVRYEFLSLKQLIAIGGKTFIITKLNIIKLTHRLINLYSH